MNYTKSSSNPQESLRFMPLTKGSYLETNCAHTAMTVRSRKLVGLSYQRLENGGVEAGC